MLAGWFVSAVALLAWPALCVNSLSGGQSTRLDRTSAQWLAAEARLAPDASTLDAAIRRASDVASTASMRFLDGRCAIVSPTSLAGRPSQELTCIDGVPTARREDADSVTTIVPVGGTTPHGATWVVIRSAARRDDARLFWLASLCSLLAMGLIVWNASRILIAGITAPLGRFANAAATAASLGPGHLGSQHGLSALDRVAEIIEFLMSQRQPRSRQQDAVSRPRPATAPPVPSAKNAGEAAPSRASLGVRFVMTLSSTFVVTGFEGDAAAFGLTPGTGVHVLDVVRGTPALAAAVLRELGRQGRGGAPSDELADVAQTRGAGRCASPFCRAAMSSTSS